MVISDTVDLVLGVHGEGHPVQTLVTDDAAEAAGVVGLPEGLQDLGAEKKRPGLRGGYGDGLDGVKEGNRPGRGTPLDRGQERAWWETANLGKCVNRREPNGILPLDISLL